MKRISGFALSAGFFAIGGVPVALLPVHAQTFPAKPIRVIGIATAGSSSDVIGRAAAEVLGRQIGGQVVVENRAGAGGTIEILPPPFGNGRPPVKGNAHANR